MTEDLSKFSPQLHPYQLHIPRTNQPLILYPINPLEQMADLPQQILEKLGVLEYEKKQNKQFMLSNFFPNCSCSCSALSKQTLNQIDRHPDIEQQKRKHMTDEKKRKRYRQIFSLMVKNVESSKKIQIFQDLYTNFGHVNEEEWRNAINRKNTGK